MAERRVTHTEKDLDGDITALCNPTEPWSPRSARDAIADIETREHTYHVLWSTSRRTNVRVATGRYRKYLRTDSDNTLRNNLLDLPDW